MKPGQTNLYWRTWTAAAAQHGWNTREGLAAALQARASGAVWESPDLDKTLAGVYEFAGRMAGQAGHSVTADDLRHGCHVAAIGTAKSSRTLTNSDLDKILDLLRVLADPTSLRNLTALQDQDQGARRRYLYVIRQASQPYWRSVMLDRFGHDDLARLDLEQLRQVAMTIRARLATKQTA